LSVSISIVWEGNTFTSVRLKINYARKRQTERKKERHEQYVAYRTFFVIYKKMFIKVPPNAAQIYIFS